MGFDFKFTDNSGDVMAALERAVAAGLEEAGGEFEAQVVRNYDPRTDSGDTKASFGHKVEGHTVYVGSDVENAIWEEFGTGIYAEKGDGRKTPWGYTDQHGEDHWTWGKRGTRALTKAMRSKVKAAERRMKAKLGGLK
ncbi:MAG: hypothetical protein RR178_05220 [Gordonibacter sp.]